MMRLNDSLAHVATRGKTFYALSTNESRLLRQKLKPTFQKSYNVNQIET